MPGYCFTEPLVIACPVCSAAVCEWCVKDERERRWIGGAPVHLERVAEVNRQYPPRKYPKRKSDAGLY